MEQKTKFESGDATAQYQLQQLLENEKQLRLEAEEQLRQKEKELTETVQRLSKVNGQQEALLSQEGKSLDGAFVNLVDPYIIMDLSSKVISMNPSAKEFLGYDHEKEDVILADLVHPDYVSHTQKSFKFLHESGVIKNFTVKITTKTKGLRYVNINANLIYNNRKIPVAAQGTIRDVTESVHMQGMLEQQKKQLDIIFDNSSLGILLIVDNKISKANQAICDMLEYTEAELVKYTLEEISTVEDVTQFEQFLSISDLIPSNSITQTRMFHKRNGGTLYGKTSERKLSDPEDHQQYKVVMIEDITKEKWVTDQLTASEARMVSMIENLQSGVLFENRAGNAVITNKKFVELFNIPFTGKYQGINTLNVLKACDNGCLEEDSFFESTKMIMERREAVLGQEIALAGGRVMSRDYIPLFDEDEELSGHLWTYHDVTLQKNYRHNWKFRRKGTALL